MKGLTREIIIDILENVLDTKVVSSSKAKKNLQFNCTVHGESNPSAGILVESGVFNCFSCHASGNIPWLLVKSIDSPFKSVYEAEYFLKTRYNITSDHSMNEFSQKNSIKRFDDFIEEPQSRLVLPLATIAPFRSGKETFRYFYDRGFTRETVVQFRIGRDLKSKTITIPIFWEDKTLAGVLGRYIDPNRRKNERYKIYEFDIGEVLFPLDKLEVIDDTIILVEGSLDAIYMHELGYTNTLATLGNTLSVSQAKIVKSNCCKVIDMFDNDQGGRLARDIAKKRLGKDVIYYTVEYPEGKKDARDCSKGEIDLMLINKRSSLRKNIERL